MFVFIRLVPARVRTVGTFQASDPWNAGRTCDFNLEAYKMAPKGARRPQDTWGGKEIYGIRSEADGVERMLPDSLGVLATEGRIPKEALPKLLIDMAPSLRKRDFNPLWGTTMHYWIGGFFALIVAMCLAMAGMQVVSAGPSGHEPVRTTLAEWTSRPMVENEYVVTEGGAKLDGSVDADFAPSAPPSITTYPSQDGRYRLGWVRAGAAERLVLVPAPLAAAGSVNVTGVTLRASFLGVPPATLARLKARVPSLETDLVTCVFWSWSDGYAGSSMGVVFWGALAAIALVGGSIPVLSVVLAKARRRRQMQWALGRV